MHLLYTSLAILVAMSAPARCATLRQYSRDWLITDLEPRETKRITAKSVFIAPSFGTADVQCDAGFRQDASGRCVKLVRVSQTAQLDFLLQKLNAMYGAPMGKPDSAPLQIDLALPVKKHEDCVEVSTGSSAEETSTTESSTTTTETPVSISTSVSNPSTTVSSTETSTIANGSSTETTSTTESTTSTATTSSTSESSTDISTIEITEATESTTLESSTSLEDNQTTTLNFTEESLENFYPFPPEVDTETELTTLPIEKIPEVVLVTNNKPSKIIKNTSHGVDSVQVLEEDVSSVSSEALPTESGTTTVIDGVTLETSTDFVSEIPILILDGVKVESMDEHDVSGVKLEAELDSNMKLIDGDKIVNEDEEVEEEVDTEKGTELLVGEKEVVNDNKATNSDSHVGETVSGGTATGLSSAEIELDNVSIGSQIPVSKPTRNSYPGIEDILNIEPKPGENFGQQLQSHNLNPSQLVPPLFENKGPQVNRLPDYPFGLEEIRNPEVPPLQVFRPYQLNPNNYNLHQQQYPYQHQQNYQQNPNRNPQNSFVVFPTDNQRDYPPIDKVNVVKFPQEHAYSDDKHRQWQTAVGNGWRIDSTRRHQQRPPPSMRF